MAEITKELGRIPVSRGEYQEGTIYYKENIVQYRGSSYQVISESSIHDVSPIDENNTLNPGWKLFAGPTNIAQAVSYKTLNGYYSNVQEALNTTAHNFNNIHKSIGTPVLNLLDAPNMITNWMTYSSSKITINPNGTASATGEVREGMASHNPILLQAGTYYIRSYAGSTNNGRIHLWKNVDGSICTYKEFQSTQEAIRRDTPKGAVYEYSFTITEPTWFALNSINDMSKNYKILNCLASENFLGSNEECPYKEQVLIGPVKEDIETLETSLNKLSKSAFNLSKDVINIKENDDLNDYTTAGTFVSINSNISTTLKNTPTDVKSIFKLIVSVTGVDGPNKYIVQEIQDARNKRYYVRSCNSKGFGEWKEYATVDLVTSISNNINNKFSTYDNLHGGTYIIANDDLNNYTTAGVYVCNTGAVTQTLSNIPTGLSVFFKLRVDLVLNGEIIQTIEAPRTHTQYVRYLSLNQTWSAWKERNIDTIVANQSNLYDLNYDSTKIITANTDLNTITTAGTYHCNTPINVQTLINKPYDLTQNCKLIVEESIVGEVKQTIWSPREKTWIRYKNNIGWTEWSAIVLKKDNIEDSILYSGIKFTDGYAHSNTCIIPAAKEEEDVEGTVIISFTTGDDVDSTQTVLNLGPSNDSTRIRINSSNLELSVRNVIPSKLISITPNTKYTVIFNNKGRVAINGIIYQSTSVALKALTGTILGVRRTGTKSEPFKGSIHYLCGFDSNFTDLSNDEFKNLTQNISSENYYTANKVIDSKLINPNGSQSIEITGQYSLDIKSENFKDDIINNTSEIENIKEYLNNISGIAGSIRTAGSSSPDYTEAIGDVTSIFNHFKLGLVKNGVLQYFVKQNNINWDEQGKFMSILNGEDGDLLVVNDTPIYYLIYPHKDYDLKLFSLAPFTYQGVPCKTLPVRGDAPSFGYIDNVNSSNGNRSPKTVKEALGNGQIHYCRKAENIAHCDYPTMHYIKGRYIPTQDTGGNISYKWDSEAMYVTSGAYRPSVYVDLRSAERAALNKNTNELLYTNKDVLSREILIAMLNAEYKTKNVNNPQLFGAGWCNYASATDASQFEDDVTLAKSGIRFKNNAGEWIYSSLSSTPFTKFTSNQFLYCLVSDWYSPWEIMEQHLAISYAVEHNIPANTWYVFNSFEYKYRNVPGSLGLDDGVMTCVLFKKFRSKLNGETILKETGENLEGNDIEFVISSALYRGWVIDNAPQMWLTGINVVCTNKNVFTYVQHNYKKYLMDKNYGENEDVVRSYSKVLETEGLWDFQKTYELSSILPNNSSIITASKTSSKCLMVPQEEGGGVSSYECCVFEPDMVGNREDSTKCADGEKIITGVKSGYGPFDGSAILNKLYMNHPRTDTAARTCYSSFVCQRVEINN